VVKYKASVPHRAAYLVTATAAAVLTNEPRCYAGEMHVSTIHTFVHSK